MVREAAFKAMFFKERMVARLNEKLNGGIGELAAPLIILGVVAILGVVFRTQLGTWFGTFITEATAEANNVFP